MEEISEIAVTYHKELLKTGRMPCAVCRVPCAVCRVPCAVWPVWPRARMDLVIVTDGVAIRSPPCPRKLPGVEGEVQLPLTY